MRILHVIPSMGPAYGGPSKVLQELAAALTHQGLTVDVATTNANGNEKLEVPIGVPVKDGVVRTFFFPQQAGGSYVFSWPLTQWLWREQKNYDLIHLHSIFSYPTLAASRIARLAKRPYVITPHGMVEPWCLSYKAWKKQPYLKLIERGSLSGASALHALVPEEEQHLRALNLVNPLFVLPNGINLREYSSLPSQELFLQQYPQATGQKIVLFMGRIDPKKGLDLTVKSFARVLRETKDRKVCLVIAGPDLVNFAGEVKKLIAAEGIGEQVIFTGMVTGALKLSLLQAADIFVLPSHSEGFSLAILEALAAGCPVIISEACNFPQVAARNAGRVIQVNVDALTNSLREMLQNDELRSEMGLRGKQMVHGEYGWQMIAARLSEVYLDILAGTRKASVWTSALVN